MNIGIVTLSKSVGFFFSSHEPISDVHPFLGNGQVKDARHTQLVYAYGYTHSFSNRTNFLIATQIFIASFQPS